jgi:hypothetical protein
MSPAITDREAAEALGQVIGTSPWAAVTFAHGYLAVLGGKNPDEAARFMYQRGPQTLRKSRELLSEATTRTRLPSCFPP